MKVLTGIKPTGKIHLGNYIGAVKPFSDLNYDSGYFFIADYHAMTTPKIYKEIKENTRHLSAALLSFFDETPNTKVYRQSRIPQVFELYYILGCFLNKGWLNRAHAYKTIQTQNIENGKDPDLNVNMGIYSYPVLMAADILLFSPDYVPVGKDQLQHIEIMEEVARNLNYLTESEVLHIPAKMMTETQTLCGSDGRKMSKSYGNTIEIFESEKTLKKKVFSIPTNSKNRGESKEADESEVTNLFKFFSTEEEYTRLITDMKEGIGWGEVKERTYIAIMKQFERNRFKYSEYMEHPDLLEKKLTENEVILQQEAQEAINKLRDIIGFN